MALSAAAEETVETLTVVVDNRSLVAGWCLGEAQATVGKMFAGIGVRIKWRTERLKSLQALQIEQPVLATITDRTPLELHRGALAIAQPDNEGASVRILYDRMEWARKSRSNLLPMLLAQVMAHEIAHVLQGISRHSEAGVLKPTTYLTNP